MSEATSHSLIVRVRAGDSAAWSQLVQDYGPLVYTWCRKAGLQAADAADVLQEVFQRVHRSIRGFDHDRAGATFHGWLRRITQHQIQDHFRRCHREPQAAEHSSVVDHCRAPSSSSSAETSGSGPERRYLMRRIVAELQAEFEPRTWQAFWQTTVEQRSVREVGEQLGMSVAAVRQAKYRVLQRLRLELEPA